MTPLTPDTTNQPRGNVKLAERTKPWEAIVKQLQEAPGSSDFITKIEKATGVDVEDAGQPPFAA